MTAVVIAAFIVKRREPMGPSYQLDEVHYSSLACEPPVPAGAPGTKGEGGQQPPSPRLPTVPLPALLSLPGW